MSGWAIRAERPTDEAAISALTAAAFASARHSSRTEAAIVERLRQSAALCLSLLAEDSSGAAVGHVAFSAVLIDGRAAEWFGLGPVSVDPARQGHGIGSALIREGLAQLQQRGAHGCVVLGEPAYYRRFGFEHDPLLAYPGPPAEYFQRLLFRGRPPQGVVSYPPAFG